MRGADARMPASAPSTSAIQIDQAARLFEVSERDSPFARVEGARFGAHQFHEAMNGTLVYAVWFSAGLRIIDVADPYQPREVAHFIPEPVAGRAAPQSNDVMLDPRGLIISSTAMSVRHLEFAG